MVKTQRKRSNKNFVAIPMEGSFNISTLASKGVISDDFPTTAFTEDLFVISIDIMAEILVITSGEGNPSMFGFAHGDYTDAEIAEALNVALTGPGSKIEQERSRRLVRKVGPFYGNELNTHTSMRLSGKQGPGETRTKIKFMIQSGQTIRVFVYNKSGAVYTTGAVCKFFGTLYGRWVV